LSALLRAILYADDPNYSLQGFRKLDPITSPEGELRFLQAAEALFHKGWQLGSEPEIQVASIVSNHLTSGILKYFGDSSRFDQAVNLFEKLHQREPEVASLLAQGYIGMSERMSRSETCIPYPHLSLTRCRSESRGGDGKCTSRESTLLHPPPCTMRFPPI
jgi:Chs5-Arf1p-binding protein BUD7/BCH1